jgi:uncharacterized damage-inducible protein DinB
MLDRDTFLDYWENVRARTLRVAACIPDHQLEWRMAEGRWSFGDILRHLAGIERGMYAETAAGRPSAYRGHGAALAEGREAVDAYVARCHEEAMAIFRGLSDAQWTGKCITPAGTPITTWKWLRLMPEHEAHHRGQVYMMLGSLGIPTPPIYGMTEEQVAASAREP